MKRRGVDRDLILFFLLIILSGILILADKKEWLNPARNLLEKPINSLQDGIYSLNSSVGGFFQFFSSKKSLKQEKLRLEEQLRQLSFDQHQFLICSEENQKMRSLLGAPLPAKWKFLPAKAIGLVNGEMKLNQGSQAGIKEGMMVVSDNILVGKVVSVQPSSSLVQLPTNPSAKIPVVIRKPNSPGIQARGLLRPQAEKLLVDQIVQSEDVRPGDLVSTYGEVGWLPDLLIGQVNEVLQKEADIYKKAEIDPRIDYSGLRIVFVVTSY